MARDVEERIRRALQTRAGDVQPDPATWDRVQARIRRRAWVRWSVAGATAAAALVAAVLVLPGLFTQTRIDLGPADPLPGLTSGLVTTDGATIAVHDATGELLAEFDPPTDADDPPPITRVAVRPGSTGDELTVAYLRADDACERVELGWMVAASGEVSGGALGGGQGFCASDPVWSPEGDLLAWVEEDRDGAFHLAVELWRSRPPDQDVSEGSRQRIALDTPAGLDVLRATNWDAGGGGQPPTIVLLGRRDGVVEPNTLDVNPHDGALTGGGDAVVQPPAESQRSRMLADAGPAGPAAGGWDYELAVAPDGVVTLARGTGTGEPPEPMELAPEVLLPADLDSGAAWLSAGGDLVAFGAGGNGWALRWQGDGWADLVELPGVVHAAVLAPADPAPPEPSGEPADVLTYVATSGERLDVHGDTSLAGFHEMVPEAESGRTVDIIDFALRPNSTAGDFVIVWREGRGCDATLRYWRHTDIESTSGTLPATCPGRPAFAPDGTHVAWVSGPDTDAGPGRGLLLEALRWTDDGPQPGGPVGIGFHAETAETFAFDVAGWTWADPAATATPGTLDLVGYDSHGTPSAHTLPIERQGDGALASPAGATATQTDAILQAPGGASDADPAYRLESVPGTAPNTLRVVRDHGGATAEIPLPDGMLTVFGGAAETDSVWLTARGDDVLLGDGVRQAWHLRWGPDGWAEPEELAGGVQFAAPIALGAGDAPPTEPPAPDAPPADPDPAGLPAPVAATHAAIRGAAAAGDVDALAQLAGPEFTSSFGDGENPRRFFQRLAAEGELDRLVAVLDLPHGEQDGIYSWPFAHTRDMESLSAAELQSLKAIATQDEIDSWFSFGGYAGWRAGIDADGTWLYYVAGD